LTLWDIFDSAFNGSRPLVRVAAGDYATETLSRMGDDLKAIVDAGGEAAVTVPLSLG